jgi:hypothetical protein
LACDVCDPLVVPKSCLNRAAVLRTRPDDAAEFRSRDAWRLILSCLTIEDRWSMYLQWLFAKKKLKKLPAAAGFVVCNQISPNILLQIFLIILQNYTIV